MYVSRTLSGKRSHEGASDGLSMLVFWCTRFHSASEWPGNSKGSDEAQETGLARYGKGSGEHDLEYPKCSGEAQKTWRVRKGFGWGLHSISQT